MSDLSVFAGVQQLCRGFVIYQLLSRNDQISKYRPYGSSQKSEMFYCQIEKQNWWEEKIGNMIKIVQILLRKPGFFNKIFAFINK